MSSSTDFSFMNPQTMYVPVNNEVTMCIKRISFAVARVYFVNKTLSESNTSEQDPLQPAELEIDIPNGIKVYDVTNTVYCTPLKKRQDFVLCWTDNYSITFHDVPILDLVNERRWNVTTYHHHIPVDQYV